MKILPEKRGVRIIRNSTVHYICVRAHTHTHTHTTKHAVRHQKHDFIPTKLEDNMQRILPIAEDML